MQMRASEIQKKFTNSNTFFLKKSDLAQKLHLSLSLSLIDSPIYGLLRVPTTGVKKFAQNKLNIYTLIQFQNSKSFLTAMHFLDMRDFLCARIYAVPIGVLLNMYKSHIRTLII